MDNGIGPAGHPDAVDGADAACVDEPGRASRLARMSHLLALIAAEEETLRELPMPPVAYGLLALAGFGLLLAVLWSFRGTAQKIRDVEQTVASNPQHAPRDHGTHH